ncbi:sulfotransferase family 2 domain-containing protein, partial [Desulfoprunum benzoelyticum]|uniref:sulfotransferase family 2 domain-containing protein n=1 Tax=Desulfoprunum benzoelyticum TaxID=1506996 RepID=UPI001965FED9
SLVHLAAAQYGRESIISHGDYVGHSPLFFSNIPFVSGHFGYAYIEPLVKNRKVFTFLREPRERVVSLYYYCCSKPMCDYPIYNIAHNNSLESFLELGFTDPVVKARIWNNQTWQLAYGYNSSPNKKAFSAFTLEQMLCLATYHLSKLDFVGIVESFDEDVQKLFKILNWSDVC